jgi:hypothetical protein
VRQQELQRIQQVMDFPHHGGYTCIHLTRKRYRCKECSGTFFHPLSWLDDDHLSTRRFVDRIAALALERSFSDLSREYGINEKTVRNIFYGRYKDDIDTTKFDQPEYMGIDELDIAGAARGVITNLSDNCGIEFLRDCTTKTFRAYFEQMPNRGVVGFLRPNPRNFQNRPQNPCWRDFQAWPQGFVRKWAIGQLLTRSADHRPSSLCEPSRTSCSTASSGFR